MCRKVMAKSPTMKVVIALILSFLLTVPGPVGFILEPLQSDTSELVLKPIEPTGDLPSFYAIDLPWHHQELPYSCGPACLKMAFGYNGWDIDETEICNVANTTVLHGGTITSDLVRAAHFSNASTSCGIPSIQGYSHKWYGSDSVHLWWSGGTDDEKENISEDLKHLLVQEKTLILLMWYTRLKHYGHYRVLRGYDDREGVFIFADPLRTNAYSGSHWNTSYDTLYTEYWDILPYYAQIVSPWTISLDFSQTPSPSSTFEARANIDSGIEERWRAHSLSETTATLTLLNGYELTSENKKVEFQLDSMGQATVTWQVNAPAQIDSSDCIKVFVSGSLTAASYSYPMYTDTIGAENTLSVYDGTPPSISDVSMFIEKDSVHFTAVVTDETSLSRVKLQWRKKATNWSELCMEQIGNATWQSSPAIPFLVENDTIQIRVIAEDMYNNTAESVVFESKIDIALNVLPLIIVGIVVIIVIIALVIIIRTRTK